MHIRCWTSKRAHATEMGRAQKAVRLLAHLRLARDALVDQPQCLHHHALQFHRSSGRRGARELGHSARISAQRQPSANQTVNETV